MSAPAASRAGPAPLVALAPVLALAWAEAVHAPPLTLLAAAVMLAALWRRSPPGLRFLGLALLSLSASGQLHVRALGESWARRSGELVEEKLAAVEHRQAALIDELQSNAAAVAILPETLAALSGDTEQRSRLFAALEARTRGRSGLALVVHEPTLEPLAWSGRIAELQALRGLIPAGGSVFALEGTLTTTWIATVPVGDGAGRVRGLAIAEIAVSAKRHLSNEYLSDFDLLGAQDPDVEINAIDLRDPGEEAHPFPPLARPTATRLAILRSPTGQPMAAVRVTAPQPEHATLELKGRYRLATALLAALAVVLWSWPRRRAPAAVACGATLLRLILLLPGPPVRPRWSAFSSDAYASPFLGSLAADALSALRLPAAASWAEALLSPLLRSPLDLFLTTAWVLVLAGVLFARAWRVQGAGRGPLRALAGTVAAFPMLAASFAWISDTVNNSPLDLASAGLWPRSVAHFLVEISLLQVLGAGLLTLAALLAVTCPLPATPRGKATLLGLWLVLGLLAERFWPRHLIGLPLVSAVGFFLAAAWLGSAAAWWRGALTGRSLEGRAVLALCGVAALGALLYPAVAHYSEKNVRLQIEHEHAPLVRRQPQRRDYVLATARHQVDRMTLLQGTLPGPHPPVIEELAYAVWASTDLAPAGLSSAVEVQDHDGSIVSRFAFNLPTLGGATNALPASEEWSEAWETLPVGSAGRRVLHAARRIASDDGGLRGAIHLYVGDDYVNLPFLAGKDPYSTLYRSAPRGVFRDRPVDLLVWGPDRQVVFSSTDRPPALDVVLAARGASPGGVWVTLPVDGRLQHTFLFKEGERTYGLCYPRTGALRFCADLVEAVTSLTLMSALLLLLVVTYRTVLRRDSLSFPSLHDAVERRFALRVFAAFVILAVLPMGVLQVIVGKFVRDRFWKESDDQALDLAAVARKAVEDFAFFQRGESPSERPVTDAALVWVASLIRNDLDVFEGERILASSKRELYASGLLPARVSGSVYRGLVLEGQPAFLGRETIGGFSYRVVSVPVSLGPRSGILSIPLALREREVEAALDDVDRTINLASVLFLGLAGVLAHSMSRRISGPIHALTDATRRVAQGDLAARVETRRRDELQGLVDAFNQMAGDLTRQRGDLERSNRLAAWAEMARQVAHEIKNPLTPIQLSAEHLRRVFRDPAADFPAALGTCTTTILRQVEILRDIATEFSAFARPPGAPEPLDLAAVVRDVVRPYEGVLPTGVRLQVDLDGSAATVHGDRRLLERALVNLIENALQAVGEKGDVEVRLARGAERVEVVVEDTGPGISPEVRERAFEPFFSTKTGGSGLGLALVKKIAEDHGGDVALESPPDGGTRARLWLPSGPAALAAQ
jgi:signal transduction histidine kinase